MGISYGKARKLFYSPYGKSIYLFYSEGGTLASDSAEIECSTKLPRR
jgi:hypothetical protein